MSDIVVAQVDCMMAGALCIAQDISTFPQLILFSDKERIAIYPRQAPHGVYEFIDFVDQHRNPFSLFQGLLTTNIHFNLIILIYPLENA